MDDRRSGQNGPGENPVQARRPLAVREIPRSDTQTTAVLKLVEGYIEVVTRLNLMGDDMVKLGATTVTLDQHLTDHASATLKGFGNVESKIDQLATGRMLLPPPLPPMRREADSSAHLLELGERLGSEVAKQAEQIIADPNASLTPDIVKSMFQTQFTEAMKAQKESDRIRKLEADEQKRIADAEKSASDAEELRKAKAADKRQLKILVYSGVIVALVTSIAGAAVSYSVGHDKGQRDHERDTQTAPPAGR